jgi:hypothetical protein
LGVNQDDPMPDIAFYQRASDVDHQSGDPRQAAVDYEQLRRFALGLEPTDVRGRAIVAVATADATGRVPVLDTILRDESTPLRWRYLAATLLGRIDSDSARAALLNALGLPDPGLVGRIAQSLGRVGRRTAIEPLTKVAAALDGRPREQARFAVRLLAHRFNVELPGEEPPDAPLLSTAADDAQPIRVMRADPIEAQMAARDLAREPFGIELNEQGAHTFICHDSWSMLLFDRALGDPLRHAELFSRRRLAAVVGRKAGDDGLYSPSLLVLSAPGADAGRVSLSLYQPSGTLVLFGSAIEHHKALAFQLRSVARRGGVAVRIKGTLAGDNVALDVGLTGYRRRDVGHPTARRGDVDRRRTKTP